MTHEQDQAVERTTTWALWLANVVAGISIALGGALLGKVNTMDTRIAAIEASRFTAQDGLNVWKEVYQIRNEIAALPQGEPPAWFVERVDKLEQKLDALSTKVGEIELRETVR
ncbi:MAG: hypothetical protein D6781_02300 [Verrucomicrobia bacterium]|nr:MAG: hypothetical protein D6781_02300 [Verrucomicrobiota bacterium]